MERGDQQESASLLISFQPAKPRNTYLEMILRIANGVVSLTIDYYRRRLDSLESKYFGVFKARSELELRGRSNMALEAVVFPQYLFGCATGKAGEVWGYDSGGGPADGDASPVADGTSSAAFPEIRAGAAFVTAAGRRKRRRRTKSFKNQEEVENQRMTHIAVERNRRKQMNEYLAVLRSLMPPSFSQRGDQASVVGGAINFVKELEKLVQSLQVHERIKQRSAAAPPFADFFAFPQYSSRSATATGAAGEGAATEESVPSSAADIEVTMVEGHANLKILARRRPKQLLRLVVGLQDLHLTALHLNITTVDEMVLYSFSLKVEDQCRLTSMDDIASAVDAIVRGIQGEAAFD